jgi:hypothetical protein
MRANDRKRATGDVRARAPRRIRRDDVHEKRSRKRNESVVVVVVVVVVRNVIQLQ